jgi:hypothetical protein
MKKGYGGRYGDCLILQFEIKTFHCKRQEEKNAK